MCCIRFSCCCVATAKYLYGSSTAGVLEQQLSVCLVHCHTPYKMYYNYYRRVCLLCT